MMAQGRFIGSRRSDVLKPPHGRVYEPPCARVCYTASRLERGVVAPQGEESPGIAGHDAS
jgi:hypothetical protein